MTTERREQILKECGVTAYDWIWKNAEQIPELLLCILDRQMRLEEKIELKETTAVADSGSAPWSAVLDRAFAERITELETALRQVIAVSFKHETDASKIWSDIEAIVWPVLPGDKP